MAETNRQKLNNIQSNVVNVKNTVYNIRDILNGQTSHMRAPLNSAQRPAFSTDKVTNNLTSNYIFDSNKATQSQLSLSLISKQLQATATAAATAAAQAVVNKEKTLTQQTNENKIDEKLIGDIAGKLTDKLVDSLVKNNNVRDFLSGISSIASNVKEGLKLHSDTISNLKVDVTDQIATKLNEIDLTSAIVSKISVTPDQIATSINKNLTDTIGAINLNNLINDKITFDGSALTAGIATSFNNAITDLKLEDTIASKINFNNEKFLNLISSDIDSIFTNINTSISSKLNFNTIVQTLQTKLDQIKFKQLDLTDAIASKIQPIKIDEKLNESTTAFNTAITEFTNQLQTATSSLTSIKSIPSDSFNKNENANDNKNNVFVTDITRAIKAGFEGIIFSNEGKLASTDVNINKIKDQIEHLTNIDQKSQQNKQEAEKNNINTNSRTQEKHSVEDITSKIKKALEEYFDPTKNLSTKLYKKLSDIIHPQQKKNSLTNIFDKNNQNITVQGFRQGIIEQANKDIRGEQGQQLASLEGKLTQLKPEYEFTKKADLASVALSVENENIQSYQNQSGSLPSNVDKDINKGKQTSQTVTIKVQKIDQIIKVFTETTNKLSQLIFPSVTIQGIGQLKVVSNSFTATVNKLAETKIEPVKIQGTDELKRISNSFRYTVNKLAEIKIEPEKIQGTDQLKRFSNSFRYTVNKLANIKIDPITIQGIDKLSTITLTPVKIQNVDELKAIFDSFAASIDKITTTKIAPITIQGIDKLSTITLTPVKIQNVDELKRTTRSFSTSVGKLVKSFKQFNNNISTLSGLLPKTITPTSTVTVPTKKGKTPNIQINTPVLPSKETKEKILKVINNNQKQIIKQTDRRYKLDNLSREETRLNKDKHSLISKISSSLAGLLGFVKGDGTFENLGDAINKPMRRLEKKMKTDGQKTISSSEGSEGGITEGGLKGMLGSLGSVIGTAVGGPVGSAIGSIVGDITAVLAGVAAAVAAPVGITMAGLGGYGVYKSGDWQQKAQQIGGAPEISKPEQYLYGGLAGFNHVAGTGMFARIRSAFRSGNISRLWGDNNEMQDQYNREERYAAIAHGYDVADRMQEARFKKYTAENVKALRESTYFASQRRENEQVINNLDKNINIKVPKTLDEYLNSNLSKASSERNENGNIVPTLKPSDVNRISSNINYKTQFLNLQEKNLQAEARQLGTGWFIYQTDENKLDKEGQNKHNQLFTQILTNKEKYKDEDLPPSLKLQRTLLYNPTYLDDLSPEGLQVEYDKLKDQYDQQLVSSTSYDNLVKDTDVNTFYFKQYTIRPHLDYLMNVLSDLLTVNGRKVQADMQQRTANVLAGKEAIPTRPSTLSENENITTAKQVIENKKQRQSIYIPVEEKKELTPVEKKMLELQYLKTIAENTGKVEGTHLNMWQNIHESNDGVAATHMR